MVKDIPRQTRRHLSAEDKIHIVLDNYFLPGDLDAQIEAFVEHYNYQRLLREPEQRVARRRLLRQGTCHYPTARKDQATDHRESALATPQTRRLTAPQTRPALR